MGSVLLSYATVLLLVLAAGAASTALLGAGAALVTAPA